MSGLREVIAHAAAEASIAYHKSCNPSFWLNDEHVKDEIEIAEGGEMLHVADAVLRVLAEHGDTEQVREELHAALFYEQNEHPVFRWADEHIRADLDPYMPKMLPEIMAVVAPIEARAERAEADLAAARQQLDSLLTELRHLRSELDAESRAIYGTEFGDGTEFDDGYSEAMFTAHRKLDEILERGGV